MINKIYQGDALEVLKTFPEESIDCVMTSPPYFQQRNYDVDGQLGLEKTPEEFVNKLCDVFDEVKRVLKKTGTCWINLGDCYGGFQGKNSGYPDNKTRAKVPQIKREKSFAKCLLCVPERFAIEMINRGWILRNKIIWNKPNVMPTSARDRFTIDYEMLFFFVKSKKYFFNQQFEPFVNGSDVEYRKKLRAGKKYDLKKPYEKDMPYAIQKNGKYESINFEKEHRQGMHKLRGKSYVEKRDLLPQKDFVDELRENFTIEDLIKKGLKKTVVEHWFRYDNSGFSYPTKEEWERVKTDLFPELLKVRYELDDIKSNKQGRNKRCVWKIATKPFKGSHFAVYPEELCETPIKAGCPKFVCKKCGKPKIKVYKKIGEKKVPPIGGIKQVKNINPTYSGKDTQNIYDEGKYISSCNCNAGFIPGVVLDPFFGAGTTGVVAVKQNKRFIGIELNSEYIKIAKKRIKPFLEQEKLK